MLVSVTPSGSCSAQSRQLPVDSSANSAANSATGVKRQSSSRPCGTGKSATAYDWVRSARDWSGTIVAAEWVWAPAVGSVGPFRPG